LIKNKKKYEFLKADVKKASAFYLLVNVFVL